MNDRKPMPKENKWYYYLPPILLPVLIIVTAYLDVHGRISGKTSTFLLLPAALLFFVLYFVVIFKKNLSKLFIIPFFFAVLNLIVYVIMLCLPPNPRQTRANNKVESESTDSVQTNKED